MQSFEFPARSKFLARRACLQRLEDWWEGDETNALVVYGRRRVGKSWLVRNFAHGKPALILVADRRSLPPQLERFAGPLSESLGVRPSIRNLPELFQAVYQLGATEKLLVVLDEFPYLLPGTESERNKLLTAVQAVMEDRDASRVKLVLCGSYIATMERLLSGPLRGRLTPLLVSPATFADCQAFHPASASALTRIESYSVSGGMATYLDEIAREPTLQGRIIKRVLDPRGPLFNDPREVLEEELRAPGVYYSILDELARGKRSLGDVATSLRKPTTDLQTYLDTLREMRVIDREAPVTARGDVRVHQYRLADNFIRFWFRFVFPYQEELKAGLDPGALYRDEIAPEFSDHVSPTFELLSREWVRRQGLATSVGSWWGPALAAHRQNRERFSEEVDVVGLRQSSVTLLGECKWTNELLGIEVLRNLETFKIPAMREAKVRFSRTGVTLVLFAKSGFSKALRDEARRRDDIRMVAAAELVDELARS